MVTRPEPSYRIVDVLNIYALQRALREHKAGVTVPLIVVDTEAKKYSEMRFQAETFFPGNTEEDLRAVMALPQPSGPSEVRFHAWVSLDRSSMTLPLEHVVIVLNTETRTGLVFPLS